MLHRCMTVASLCLLLMAIWGATPLGAQEKKDAPWPSPVAGFQAPQAGEHPRLFFCKADLAEIRKRAATAEGQVIVARLKLVGSGEAMPTEYNPNRGKQADGSGDFHAKAAVGKTYTLWHGAGFGMLWQLTREKKYADLGRQCVEKAFEGQRDRDDRYSFRDPVVSARRHAGRRRLLPAGECGGRRDPPARGRPVPQSRLAWMQNGAAAVSHGWTPEKGFLRYRWHGYDEALIIYLLGLGSPTHPLPLESYRAWTSTRAVVHPSIVTCVD